MGITLGLLSKLGVPGVNKISTDLVYEKFFKDKGIKTFEDFHTAFIELCRFLNDIMPGKHYAAPSKEEIMAFYVRWTGLDLEERQKEFIKFMQDNVKELRLDNQMVIMAGVVAPTAAVMLKRTAEDNIPQVKRFKLHLIPNFIFAPSCTLLALAGVRFYQINQKGKT